MALTRDFQKYILRLFIPLLFALFLSLPVSAATLQADPDHISTAIEYRGVSDLRIGDSFGFGPFSFGGMVDIRNEERFNQKILPNHNWRGFASIYCNLPAAFRPDTLFLTAGFEHESAHQTMGLNDGNDRAYDKVYDGTWRNVNLNSFIARVSYVDGPLTMAGDFQFYFNSRNTPELPVSALSWSEGISGGIEYRYPVAPEIDIFLSVFDRYIFQSKKKVEGNIYFDGSSGIETRTMNYQVINNVNTFTAKFGITFNDIISDRKLSLYCGFLYGNIYGFVDSREKRKVYSAGIELFH